MSGYLRRQWLNGSTTAPNGPINDDRLNEIEDALEELKFLSHNILDYGAVGDDVTDDTAAIQAAVNDASVSGRPVVIPEASDAFKVTSVTLPHTGNVRIVGLGPKSILHQTAAADRAVFWHNSNIGVDSIDNVRIEGVTLLGAGQGVAGGGNNQRVGIQLELVSNLVIKDCVITDFRDAGINLYPKGNIRIERNRVQRIGSGGGWQAVNVANFTYGNSSQVGRDNYGDFWCIDNYVSDSPNGGIALSCSSGAAHYPSMETRCYVIGNTVVNCDWVGIAIEQRYSQEGIISRNQVYNCWIGIQIGTGGGTDFSNLTRPTLYLVSENLIDSRQRHSGAVSTGGGIVTTGSRLAIVNNIIRHSVSAVQMSNAGGATELGEDNLISGNLMECSTGNLSNTSSAIYLNDQKNCRVEGNQIIRQASRVVVGGTIAAGGQLEVSTVEGFEATGSITVRGVQYAYTAITPATPTVNAKITLTAGGTFVAGDDVFQGSCGYGVYVQFSVDTVIQGNTIRNPGQAGIRTAGNTRTSILDNKILNPWSSSVGGTKMGLYLSGGGTDTRVERNAIVDATGAPNATIGVQIDTGETRPVLLDNLVDGISTAYNTVPALLMDRGNRKSKTHIPNGGVFTSTPGAVSTVSIPHGLLGIPTVFGVQAGNAAARGAPALSVTADVNNIVITFAGNLSAATSYAWNWHARI